MNSLRDPARLAREFPLGSEHVNSVKAMTLKTIDALDDSLDDAFAVAPFIRNSRRRQVSGMICYHCRSLQVEIIPLELSDSLVVIDEDKRVFVRTEDGADNLFYALAAAAEAVFATMAESNQ